MLVCVLTAYLSVYHLHAWSRSGEDVGSLGTGVTDGCELPCEYRESSLEPLEEQPVLLNPEASLQPVRMPFKNICGDICADNV